MTKIVFSSPKKVIFCKTCVLSNQKPVTIPEFRHTIDRKGALYMKINSDGICDGCKYHKLKYRTINWKRRAAHLMIKNGLYGQLITWEKQYQKVNTVKYGCKYACYVKGKRRRQMPYEIRLVNGRCGISRKLASSVSTLLMYNSIGRTILDPSKQRDRSNDYFFQPKLWH